MLAETIERELKLVAKRSLSWPPDLPGDPLEPRVFESMYFDTPRRTLARGGITLRRRVEDGTSLWQLKLPAGEVRREIEVAGGETLPRELRSLLRAQLAVGPLEQVAVLRTERSGIRVQTDHRAVADVVLDEVDAVDDNGAASRFREIEVELVEGDESELAEIRKTLLQSGARAASGTPKLFRVLSLEPPKPPKRAAPAIEHVRRAVARQVEELLARDIGLRLGDDVEELHDFRVATRRLRAILRAAQSLLGAERVEPLRRELAWLGAQVGRARDIDVMLEHLSADISSLPEVDSAAGQDLVELLAEDRPPARKAVQRTLASKRYLSLLAGLDELAHDSAGAVEQVSLRQLARRDLRRLTKAIDALGPSPADDPLHATRILAKRARYAAELAEPIAPGPLEKLVDSLKALQDAIGQHQDAVVLEARLRRAAETADTPAVTLAAGILIERQRERRRAARAAVPAVWRRVERSAKKAFK